MNLQEALHSVMRQWWLSVQVLLFLCNRAYLPCGPTILYLVFSEKDLLHAPLLRIVDC